MAKYASSAGVEFFKPEFMRTVGSTTLSRLRIPSNFYAEYLGEHDDNVTVTLISDQLSSPWIVTLEGETLRNGWPDFAKALKLKVNDCIVFRYKGNYVFRVTAFDADGEKLAHQQWEQPQHFTHGGNISRVKGKGKVVERDHGGFGRSQRNSTYGGSASQTYRGSRSPKNTAAEEVISFIQPVTDSNIEKNEVYIPRRFVELICNGDKDLGCVTLTNNAGQTWVGGGIVSTDLRLRITGCWTLFYFDNDLAPRDCCQFQIVENTDHIVLKLLTPDEDEVEPFSPGGQVQYGGGSGLRVPKVEGSSKYSSWAGRGQKGQARDK